ncbi:MAG: photosynthetic complex assembly protein PuhC [Pseudomonadota bacterium]
MNKINDPFKDNPIPKGMIYAAGILIVFTILIATFSKHTGMGRTVLDFSVVVQDRDLFFEDQSDGSILIISADSNEIIKTLHSGEGGFIRGVMRGLVRERRSFRAGPETPFKVQEHADGRYSILDPVTQRQIDLQPFGTININAFAELLEIQTKGIRDFQQITMNN